MRRFLNDLNARFDLEYRVRGVRLAELIERLEVNLDDSPLEDWGTVGPASDVVTASRGPVYLRYTPHLFPGMDLKLRLAHKLQYHLLPTEVPTAAPVRLAAVLESFCHLSGDLFGWRMQADGRLLIWIVDMAGHGLETGLASAVMKAIIDSLHDQSRVHELVGELNEALSQCSRPVGRTLFATGFFMTLAANGAAEFCSAGHPPAFITGKNGTLRELKSTSLPIGLFQHRRFVSEKIRVAEGETLFLYTDGLIELTTPAGEPFGLPQLREILQGTSQEPAELTESLHQRIARDHDMARLEDDVTFLVARMESSGVP